MLQRKGRRVVQGRIMLAVRRRRSSWLTLGAHLAVALVATTTTTTKNPRMPRAVTLAYGDSSGDESPPPTGHEDKDEEEEESYDPKDWYQRYPAYPPYCSTPDEMKSRSIPPLTTPTDPTTDLTLVHVTVVVRHGARTPYASNLNCWENYTAMDTGVWNCRLTTLMAPPSQGSIEQSEKGTADADNQKSNSSTNWAPFFMFEKRYDALQDPRNGLSNELNGTCQVGQLLLRGYEQEMANGRMLRDAYLDPKSDPRMRLSLIDPTQPWNELYYRADDDQRTLTSGEVLLRGLLGDDLQRYYGGETRNGTTADEGPTPPPPGKSAVVVPVHTADRARDVMDANEVVCPRLAELNEKWRASPEYRDFMTSQEALTLQRFQHDVLKVDDMSAVDCLMTTICTDRTLPNAVNDYRGPADAEGESTAASNEHPYGTNLFQRLFNLDAQSWSKLFVYDNASYSKLALTPLWRDVVANLQGKMSLPQNASATVCCPLRRPPTLAIYSGHDTTLMPLLASLGGDVYDGSWPPYASMMTIELYRSNPKQEYLLRLVYNGHVLTPKVPGCDANELCPASVLIGLVTAFTQNYNCARRGAAPVAGALTEAASSSDVFSTPGGVMALCLLVMSSALFGSLGTYLYVVGRRRPRRGGRQPLPQRDDHDEEGVSMHFPSRSHRGADGDGTSTSASSLS